MVGISIIYVTVSGTISSNVRGKMILPPHGNFLYGRDELTIWRHGRNFRIDTNVARGLHYHLRTASTGIGVHRTKWINEIIGGLSGLLGTLLRGTK